MRTIQGVRTVGVIMELDEFRNMLLEDVRSGAAAGSSFTEQAFLDKVASILIESDEIDGIDQSPFRGKGIRGKSVRIDGFSISNSEPLASLFVVDFRGKPDMETLSQTDAEDTLGRLAGFLDAALRGKLGSEIEESSPGYEVIQSLQAAKSQLERAKLYLLTDAKLSSRVTALKGTAIAGIQCEYQVWDVERLYKVVLSSAGHEETAIDFVTEFGQGVPCIPANESDGHCKSYLCVAPAKMLAGLYGKYGAKLMEQNVRTYLQERGTVNKGIRRSIEQEPTMFFAYNNGLSATAAEVRLRRGASGIPEIVFARDLQIVNGGQTTASIFWAHKSHGAALDNVFVQLKLNVVPPDQAPQIVPKIAEYANSQNKISAADFFSNHPFHVRLEEISRRVLAPAVDGAQFGTHWFYERARGQFLNAQAGLTVAAKKQFLLRNPRTQLLTKTDLAKIENAFGLLPHVVSQGAQKNFSRFAKVIAEAWDAKQEQFNEEWFRNAAAKAILFRATERLVSEQPWYDGGYRANIVAYSVALLSYSVETSGKALDFRNIWMKQAISTALTNALATLSKQVTDVLTQPPEGRRNVSEWAKLETCWSAIKALQVRIPAALDKELIEKSERRLRERDSADQQGMDNGIAAQSEVARLGGAYWTALLKWAVDKRQFGEKEIGILRVAAAIPRKLPSEKQALVLVQVRREAIAEGFKL
jgi:hypothetical protein